MTYLSLIQGLNSEDSPLNASASTPEDYTAELSLWTNAEFTFDVPPGFGIFENDSGFDQLAGSNNPLLQTDREDPVLGQQTDNEQQPQQPSPPTPQLEQQQPQSLQQFLDLSSQGKIGGFISRLTLTLSRQCQKGLSELWAVLDAGSSSSH